MKIMDFVDKFYEFLNEQFRELEEELEIQYIEFISVIDKESLNILIHAHNILDDGYKYLYDAVLSYDGILSNVKLHHSKLALEIANWCNFHKDDSITNKIKEVLENYFGEDPFFTPIEDLVDQLPAEIRDEIWSIKGEIK